MMAGSMNVTVKQVPAGDGQSKLAAIRGTVGVGLVVGMLVIGGLTIGGEFTSRAAAQVVMQTQRIFGSFRPSTTAYYSQTSGQVVAPQSARPGAGVTVVPSR